MLIRNTVRLLLVSLALGVAYGLLNHGTQGLTLPGSAQVVALRPQIVLPFLGGLLMGPITGFIIGFTGNALGDYLGHFGFQYWSFSLANGVMGAIPGLLPVWGIRRFDTVAHFAALLLTIVASQVIGTSVGLFTLNLVAHDGLQQLTWAFFHPIIVVNICAGFILIPPALFMLRRLTLTFDLGLAGALYYLTIVLSIVLISALAAQGWGSVRYALGGSLAPVQLDKVQSDYVLDSFRYGGMIAIVIVVAAVGLTLLVIHCALKPIRRLTEASRQLKEGAFDRINLTDVSIRCDDIGQLAQVFQEAVDHTRQREAQLRQVIDDLRVEIDTEQQHQQAAQITETDYFRSLQQRSEQIRRRKRTHSDEEAAH